MLAGLLKRIGNFSLGDFTSRLVFQKTVYLLQAFGIYLGYEFSWYIRGPYSTGLTKDGFSLGGKLDRYPPLRFGDQETEGRFQQFLEFVRPHKNDDLWLETAASTHFLVKVHRVTDKEKILKRIKRKQPHVTKAAFVETWNELERVGIL